MLQMSVIYALRHQVVPFGCREEVREIRNLGVAAVNNSLQILRNQPATKYKAVGLMYATARSAMSHIKNLGILPAGLPLSFALFPKTKS